MSFRAMFMTWPRRGRMSCAFVAGIGQHRHCIQERPQHAPASPGGIGLIARAALVLVLFEHKMIT
jgi:hypothetical protein